MARITTLHIWTERDALDNSRLTFMNLLRYCCFLYAYVDIDASCHGVSNDVLVQPVCRFYVVSFCDCLSSFFIGPLDVNEWLSCYRFSHRVLQLLHLPMLCLLQLHLKLSKFL